MIRRFLLVGLAVAAVVIGVALFTGGRVAPCCAPYGNSPFPPYSFPASTP
jgi:hypothetical protein